MKTILWLSTILLITMTSTFGETLLTIYQNGDLIVQETREMNIPAGQSVIEIGDIPGNVDNDRTRVLADGIDIIEMETFPRLEQDREYLQRRGLIGEQIIVSTITDEQVEGRLLNSVYEMGSSRQSALMIVLDNGAIRILPSNTIRDLLFPETDLEIHSGTSIRWKVYAKEAGAREVTSLYAMKESQINWSARYTLVMENGDSSAVLSGWATIDNKSEKDYESVQLRLIAGEAHRSKTALEKVDGQAFRKPIYREASSGGYQSAVINMEKPRVAVAEQAHQLYTYLLPGKTTLHKGASKDVPMIVPTELTLTPALEYHPYHNQQNVGIYVKIDTSSGAFPDLDLPPGQVAIYSNTKDGCETYLGSDMIGHTPYGEVIPVCIGGAPDIQVMRTILSDGGQRRNQRKWDSEYQVTFSNESEETVKILVRDRFYYGWKLLDSSIQSSKETVNAIEFNVSVPASGEFTFTYKVRQFRG